MGTSSENVTVSWNAISIKDLPVQERKKHCPEFLAKLIESAVSRLDPDRIWIYGSRARGDEREFSDYDLAFDVPKKNATNWPGFSIETQDEAETLHKLDLVLFSSAKNELREKILKEGVLLHEKSGTRAG